MSDFYQNGVATVLHCLGQPNVDQLERELARYGRVNPLSLVLHSLYPELGCPALKAIMDTLKSVSSINEIVISLDRASVFDSCKAKPFFSVLPQLVRLIWYDGAHTQAILKLLLDHNLDIGLWGKGQGCWTAFGYVLARSYSRVTHRLHGRVTHAVPDMFDRLVEAVEAGHAWDLMSEPAAALS